MKSLAVLVSLVFTFVSSVTQANENVIFQGNPQGQVLTLGEVMASPVYRQNEAKVLALAESQLDGMVAEKAITLEQREEIKGWFKALPFQRVIDLEFIFPGFPDAIGLCVEGNPSQYVSIEACAGLIIFIFSASVNVKSRLFHYVNITKTTSPSGSVKYKGWEFGFGPAIGKRQMAIWAIFGAAEASSIDGFFSAELTRWYSKYFGLSVQADLGLMVYSTDDNKGESVRERTLPMGKLTVGLTF